jgi:hypothetical protein
VLADLDELIGLSDTLHVMLRGALVATLDPARLANGPALLSRGPQRGPPAGTFDDFDDEGWQAGFELVLLAGGSGHPLTAPSERARTI